MSPFLGEISGWNGILLGIIFGLVILQYKNCEKILELKKKTNETFAETFAACNRCSKELYENKKNMFYKYQILDWLVLLILNVLAIKNPFHINYIPLLRTEIRNSLVSTPIVTIHFYKL